MLAFTNQKGGVGKSTLAVHLAAKLQEMGESAVLVDADVQRSSSMWLREASPDMPLVRLQTPDEVIEQIPALREKFEFVVVDGPGGLSEVTRAILFVADITFLPCGPSALDLRPVTEVIRVVRQAQAIRNGPPAAILIPNKLQERYRLTRELRNTTREIGMSAMGGLSLRQAYADAAGQGTVVWRMGKQAADAAREMNFLLEEILRGERTETIIGASVANG